MTTDTREKTWCAYCDQMYTTDVDIALIQAHIYECPEHPLPKALARLEALAPLIEAARAYRDAHAESQKRWDGVAYDAALMRLLEAARTFEVSHEEQG